MDASQSPTPKRQISRLINASSVPLCVLSKDGMVLFANQALADLIQCSLEELVGLPEHRQDSIRGPHPITSILSIPNDWARTELKLLEVDEGLGSAIGSHRVKCLLPLGESADDAILCFFSLSEPSSQPWVDRLMSDVLRTLNQSRTQSPLWFLQGESPQARTVVEQVHLATQNDVGVSIVGPEGAGQSWLASYLLEQRQQTAPSSASSPITSLREHRQVQSVVRIECRLMDRDLLQGMLDLIDESKVTFNKPKTIWLDGIDSLTEETVTQLHQFLAVNDDLRCISTTHSDVTPRKQHGKTWSNLLHRIGPLRIELPSFVSRLADLRILLSAWLATHLLEQRIESSPAFVDALMAYPWPGDIEEFSSSMQHAVEQLEGGRKLLPEHLPVAIRTAASHHEHPTNVQGIDLDAVLEDIEKKLILRALDRCPNNKTSAAKLLGISRARLLRRLQQWGMIDVDDSDGDSDEMPIFKEVK
jgi:transcriptional regulator with PAS, ATPase and Fis domain